MTKATKACLMSLFVFPGAGQIYLKHWLKGAILLIIAAACLYNITLIMASVFDQVLTQIQAQPLGVDVISISQLVETSLAETDSSSFNVWSYSFALVWVVAAVDAYFRSEAKL